MSDQELRIRRTLDLLGIEYIEKTNRLAFKCCFHDDRDPSAGFYIDTGLAHCFSCGYTLDDKRFYAKFQGITEDQAERELERATGISLRAKAAPDTMNAARRRIRMEASLQEAKPRILLEHYYGLGEMIDEVLLGEEKGMRTKEALDTLEKMWYNKVEEATNVFAGRTPRDSLDARIQKGMAEVPRLGRQDGDIDLD